MPGIMSGGSRPDHYQKPSNSINPSNSTLTILTLSFLHRMTISMWMCSTPIPFQTDFKKENPRS